MKKYIELAKKLRRLTEQGIGGERETAQKMLDNILSKYNIDTDTLNDDNPEVFFFNIQTYQHDFEAKLLNQLCRISHIVLKGEFTKALIKEYCLTGNFAIQCTKYQFVEIQAKFEFYKTQLSKRADEFFYAFCIKNNLLCQPDTDDIEPMNDEEKTRYINAVLLSKGIMKSNYLKQLK